MVNKVSVKSFFGSTVIHLLIAFVIGWFASDSISISIFPFDISFKDDSQLYDVIEDLQFKQDSLLRDNAIREGININLERLIFKSADTIDSLESVIASVRMQSGKKAEAIDSIIAVDSANAVEQYRVMLMNLGIVPDFTAHLTFREIGHGAIFLSNYQGLQLELLLTNTTYDVLKDKYNLRQQAFNELAKVNANNKLILANERQQKNEWKTAYENETGFLKDRIILGIGYGAGFNFNNEKVTTSIQAGIYFKLAGWK